MEIWHIKKKKHLCHRGPHPVKTCRQWAQIEIAACGQRWTNNLSKEVTDGPSKDPHFRLSNSVNQTFLTKKKG